MNASTILFLAAIATSATTFAGGRDGGNTQPNERTDKRVYPTMLAQAGSDAYESEVRGPRSDVKTGPAMRQYGRA